MIVGKILYIDIIRRKDILKIDATERKIKRILLALERQLLWDNIPTLPISLNTLLYRKESLPYLLPRGFGGSTLCLLIAY